MQDGERMVDRLQPTRRAGCFGRRQQGEDCTESDDASYVINGDHIDGIVDVRYESKLNATLDETPDEIIGVCY